MAIDVRPVKSKSELNAFINLPWSIYRGNPNWVPQLRGDQKKLLNRSKHPFFDHAAAEFFLARRDGNYVGRIAAITNDAHVAFHDEPVGFFGFFECIDDNTVAQSLFSHAADWLRARDLQVMRGPVSYSMNDECGLLIEGFDTPPTIMMPYNPPYYMNLITAFGFQKAKDLLAYEITQETILSARLGRLAERIKQRKNISIRPFVKKDLKQELQRVKEVYNSAWEKNWGFVPMSDREIDYMADDLIRIVEPELVLFAEIEGEPIAFILALPDFYAALKHANGRLFPFGLLKIMWHAKQIDTVRILAFGIKDAYRRQGIDGLLYYEVYRNGVEKGYRRAEMSWILEDNHLMNTAIENMGGQLSKRYRIYDYEL